LFDDRVTCLLMGLGNSTGIEHLEVSQFDAGMSFSFKGRRGRRPDSRGGRRIVTWCNRSGSRLRPARATATSRSSA
jgi:hypothetical protein